MKTDLIASAVKVTPPAAVLWIQHINENMPTVILWLTALYTLSMLVATVQKILRVATKGKEGERESYD